MLGKACAMNNKKSGNFKYLSMERCVQSYAQFKSFLENFRVSDQMHEYWYGEQKVAKEMVKEQLETKLEFGLSYLNIAYSNICQNYFKLKEYMKKKEIWWPMLMNIFGEKTLENLNFRGCNLTSKDTELIANCIYNEIENFPIA